MLFLRVPITFTILFLTASVVVDTAKKAPSYEETITFTIFNNATTEGVVSTFDTNLTEHGCDPDGNYAIIVHGWIENIETPWVMDMVTNLTLFRGGCIIFMDYSNYSMVSDYFRLTPHFYSISDLLLRKIQQIGRYDQLFMFGFSFGARLCVDAGTKLGANLIDRIDVCDPAGPGFDYTSKAIDPKMAAKAVWCINTSSTYGTNFYNCNINFRMGKCGKSQLGATKKPCGSHGLCPYFYNSAFTHNFTQENYHQCSSKRMAIDDIPADFKMGYMEDRRPQLYEADVFVPTARNFPWNVINGTLDN